jgi:hypothetical protein
MHKLSVILEKNHNPEPKVITNLREMPPYPQYLAYDTNKDLEDYYICNYGYNPIRWPNKEGCN